MATNPIAPAAPRLRPRVGKGGVGGRYPRAQEWLYAYLRRVGGSQSVAVIKAAALEAGFKSWRTITRVKKQLKIESRWYGRESFWQLSKHSPIDDEILDFDLP